MNVNGYFSNRSWWKNGMFLLLLGFHVVCLSAQEATAFHRPFEIAVKTNLLYDALLVPNAGVEVAWGSRWSATANVKCAWWNNDRKHRYWRIYGGDLEVRRWLDQRKKNVSLTGHHVGVYGQLFTYDFEWGGRGYLGDRWWYAAGLSYGYSWPIAKRLNLDCSVGIGYMSGICKEYLPMDTHYVWQVTKRTRRWGPTRVEVSLVWLVGKNRLDRKGGER